MKNNIMKAGAGLLLLFAVVSLLAACTDVRDEDIPRLIELAEEGNESAIEEVYFIIPSLKGKVDEKTVKRYEQHLLERGSYRYIMHKIREEGGYTNISDDVRLKWLKLGAEHGNVRCMLELGNFYLHSSAPDKEQARYWYQMAADNSDVEAQAMLNGNKRYVWTEALLAVGKGWKENEGGGMLSQFTNSIVHSFPSFFINTFAYLFSSKWFQGLLGLVIIICFWVGLFWILTFMESNYGQVTLYPMLWTALYGAFNGLFMLIDNFDSVVKGQPSHLHELALNVGRFTLRPSAYSQQSDLCVNASWVWIVVLLVLLAVVVISKRERLSGMMMLLLAVSVPLGYVYGVALSLLVLIVVPWYIFKFVGQEATRNYITVRDDNGNVRTLVEGSDGKWKDTYGSGYSQNSNGEFNENGVYGHPWRE